MFRKDDIIEALYWLLGLWVALSIFSLLAFATQNVRPRKSLWIDQESLTTEYVSLTGGKQPMS